MQDKNVSFSLHNATNFSMIYNGTGLTNEIYVYKPLGPKTTLALFLLLLLVGLVGFVGNVFVLCFLKTKRNTKSFLKACSFQRNFNIYVKSLAISDVLSSLISAPLVCVELYLDLFHTGLGCKIVRYLIILFPCVTINNLLVINIEKYFSTRIVPRTFRHSTVKKMVLTAWVTGCLIVSIPASTYKGLRFDLNETHYVVVCRFDEQYLPSRIIFLFFTALQYIIPMMIIIRINISLIITVRTITKIRKTVDVQRDNVIKIKFRAATIRSTCLIIALTFAFIFAYLVYFAQIITYHILSKVTIDFQTDFILRVVSALVAMTNAAVNFVLYLVQMQDLRAYINQKFASWFTAKNSKPVGSSNVDIQLISFSTLTITTVN